MHRYISTSKHQNISIFVYTPHNYGGIVGGRHKKLYSLRFMLFIIYYLYYIIYKLFCVYIDFVYVLYMNCPPPPE